MRSRFILRELPFEPDPARREQILAAGRAKEAEERLGTARADLTTAVSEVDAEYYRQFAPSPERVMLLPNVIDVDAYQAPVPGAPLPPGSLCFAGTLSHGTANVDAGLWLLDEVMPRVWQRRPELRVYLVGRDPAPALRARQAERVQVTGEVESIVPYLRQSLAALVPLRWESGTRFKILEAFACRAPVVSTSLGAEGLAVESGRQLLLADTPEQFAEAILALVERPELRQALVEPAFELVQREYSLAA